MSSSLSAHEVHKEQHPKSADAPPHIARRTQRRCPTSAAMSALVAEAAEGPPRELVAGEDGNNFPSDDDAPLSPATDYDDQTEEPLSPCGSDNGLLASSEGEIRVGPSIARPTAVEPTTTPPPPPILTDLDAPTCVICLELCGNQPVRRVHKSILGDDAAVLAPSSGEEPASPRHRAGGASMAWRLTGRISTSAP